MRNPALAHRPLSDRGAVATAARATAAAIDRNLHAFLLLPGVLCLLAVIAYPIGFNIGVSFTDRDLVFSGAVFVGLANYTRTLVDPAFWNALLHSLEWTAISVLGQLLLGLGAALALDRIDRGRAILRTLLIIPWAFPAIVMAFVWRFMLDPLYGVTNYALMLAHLIAAPVGWLGTPDTAMLAVTLMNVWFGFPFMMVAILAAIQAIPRELYESAQVDGAHYWQQFRHVILPSIRDVVAILVVLRTIWVFNNFDFVYLTTGGGPVDVTETLPVYAFSVGWLGHEVGRMAAVSALMLVVLSCVTALYFRLLRTRDAEA